MNDFDFDDGLDLEMDRRLAAFARSTREPALPDDVADLPWRVQLEAPGTSRAGFRRAWPAASAASAGPALAFARLGVTIAVAGSFLLLVGNVRSGGSGADFIQAASTPRPSGAVPAPRAPEVVVVPTSGVVDDVMADYVARCDSAGPSPTGRRR